MKLYTYVYRCPPNAMDQKDFMIIFTMTLLILTQLAELFVGIDIQSLNSFINMPIIRP